MLGKRSLLFFSPLHVIARSRDNMHPYAPSGNYHFPSHILNHGSLTPPPSNPSQHNNIQPQYPYTNRTHSTIHTP
ncbi:unnamed protein product, partial [Mycena citricolor]